MNNSALKYDEDVLEQESFDNTGLLRKQEVELVKILEALDEVIKSQGWKGLKALIFDSLEEKIDRQLSSEARKDSINRKVIYKLQGELKWAKKYASLESLSLEYNAQLKNIRQQLHGKKLRGE